MVKTCNNFLQGTSRISSSQKAHQAEWQCPGEGDLHHTFWKHKPRIIFITWLGARDHLACTEHISGYIKCIVWLQGTITIKWINKILILSLLRLIWSIPHLFLNISLLLDKNKEHLWESYLETHEATLELILYFCLITVTYHRSLSSFKKWPNLDHGGWKPKGKSYREVRNGYKPLLEGVICLQN